MLPLEACKLFNQLPAPELARLQAASRELEFAPGQVIFRAGDPGDGVYVVRAGRVEIMASLEHGATQLISQVPPGDVFGELSLLDTGARSATAVAACATSVFFVPRESMLQLFLEAPEILMKLVQEVSQRLRESNDQYIREVLTAERLALVGRFASSIVHDLKNPLCIIGLAAELMAAPGATDASRHQARERIAKQVDRITHLVNDILEFTRGEARQEVLTPIDYPAYLRAVVEEFQPELLLKSVTLELEAEPPPLHLAINPKRLNRVFTNLFGNALDMLPGGGVIRLRARVQEREVVTEVADNGPGIAPEVADRLFEPFATFGKPQGTGLGLTIIRRIVEEHGGTVRAFNAPDGGAVFAFSLPRPGK